MACKCAKMSDEFSGWECGITGGACAFLHPDSKLCAAMFGEGPDVEAQDTKGTQGEDSQSES